MQGRQFKEFGPLDVACRSLEDIHNKLVESWNSGEYRLRPHELERVAQYLMRIEVSHSGMRDTLELYKSLEKKLGKDIIVAPALIKLINHESKNIQA